MRWAGVSGDTVCGALERFMVVGVDGGSSALPDRTRWKKIMLAGEAKGKGVVLYWKDIIENWSGARMAADRKKES